MIVGKWYECIEDLVFFDVEELTKGKRYLAKEPRRVNGNESSVGLDERIIAKHFNPTPFDSDMDTKESLVEEALRIIGGDRKEAYGDVRTSFENIAKVWSVIAKTEITAEQVGLMMMGMKLVREANSHKRDNIVDQIGYAVLLGRLTGEE